MKKIILKTKKYSEKEYQIINQYPYNLIAEVLINSCDYRLDESDNKDDKLIDTLFNIRIAGVIEALDTLPEKEKTVVQLRYLDGLTYSEIADRINVTSHTRPRQIHNKAIRRLKHPSRWNLIDSISINDHLRSNTKKNQVVDKKVPEPVKNSYSSTSVVIPSSLVINDLDISNRAMNAILRYKKFRYDTPLIELVSYSPYEISNLRYMGLLSLSELVYKLYTLDLEFSDRKPRYLYDQMSEIVNPRGFKYNKNTIDKVTKCIRENFDKDYSPNTLYKN